MSFRAIPPSAAFGPDRQYRYQRADGSFVRFIETPQVPLERTNTSFGTLEESLKPLLDPILRVRKMSRIAIGALLQLAVSEMAPKSAYVNVGVWNGFTLLAAMAGNRDKLCVGIDNFSEFGGPVDAFMERFLASRSRSHKFFNQDYREFFAAGFDQDIGVYLYDGDHTFENQYEGLLIADPFYADDAVIVVDDTNLDRARSATLKFAEDSIHDWDIVLDQRTSGRRHITLWNGVMVLVNRSGSGSRHIDWSGPTYDGGFVEDCPPAHEQSLTVVNVGSEPPPVSYGGGDIEMIDASQSSELSSVIEDSNGEYLLIVDRPNPIVDRFVDGAIAKF